MRIQTNEKKVKSILEKLDKYELISFSKDNKFFIFFAVLFVLGLIAGAMVAKSFDMESLKQMEFLFYNDFKSRASENFLETFVSSIFSNFSTVLIVFIVSLSVWGVVLIPFAVCFKGFSLGVSAGYLYLIYGLKGIGFYLLILLPGIFVFSVALILFSINAQNFSFQYTKKILPKANGDTLWENLKSFLKKSGRTIALLLISALLDAAFMGMFGNFFEF